MKHPAANRLFFDGSNPTILVRDADEMFNLKHGPVIGYFTDAVNGFITDNGGGRNRSYYRTC